MDRFRRPIIRHFSLRLDQPKIIGMSSLGGSEASLKVYSIVGADTLNVFLQKYSQNGTHQPIILTSMLGRTCSRPCYMNHPVQSVQMSARDDPTMYMGRICVPRVNKLTGQR